jgi:methylthioribose-1-phosphate isomerase
VSAAPAHQRTLWPDPAGDAVFVLDQRALPHRRVELRLRGLHQVFEAIAHMAVRGAPLIGATAAYGVALQCCSDAGNAALRQAKATLDAARPTAVNLAWATQRMLGRLLPLPEGQRRAAAWQAAQALAAEDVAANSAIGEHGLAVLQDMARRKGRRLNVLTHCNAGWLATVGWGTALAPIYKAHAQGLDVHVWVDETRPRNQGAALTAWELAQAGVPHTLLADNAGGHLMQRGEVDIVIVGADRVTAQGDVCNKIGTYLKALAAHDNGVPFFAAVPLSTLDLSLRAEQVPIELRSPDEVTQVTGLGPDGQVHSVRIAPEGTPALNPAFDLTPARLVSGLITECGLTPANEQALRALTAPR